MSTRGIIAVENPDKTCRSIYVHFDMYLDGGGITLINHYTTPERVEKLLALGGLSALGDKLSEDDPEADARDTCVAYHRDYGEAEQTAEVWNSAEELLNNASDRYWAEYVYLYRNGEWVYDTPSRKYNWKSVKTGVGGIIMPKINWNITDQELKQELVSSDNRWHISKTQKGEEESKFFLTNYDLLLAPHGSGPDYKVCFETFIENCDQYIEKIKKIQQEAREHMTVLLEAAK